jgi:hypothetical protein
MNAHAVLSDLVGQELRTLSGRRNRVLRISGSDVIVATTKSPNGKPIPIAWIQRAMDQLERDGEITIDVDTVGYRSAFVGAVLSILPRAVVLRASPPRIRFGGQHG